MGISNNTVSELIKHSQKHFNPRRVFRPKKPKVGNPLPAPQTLQEILDAEPCVQSAPRPMERGLDAPVRLSLTRLEAEKHGLLDRYEMVLARRREKAARKLDAATALQAVINQAKQFAAEQDLSHRKLLAQAGLSWGSWKRCESGQADPVIWLPKIQSALDRVFRARHD